MLSCTKSEDYCKMGNDRQYETCISSPCPLVGVNIIGKDSESLRTTHNVVEELQMKLESLPGNEMTLVEFWCWYEVSHYWKKAARISTVTHYAFCLAT